MKLSKSKIKSRLKASEPDSLPDKFVAAAVQIGANGSIQHAAIAVGSEYGKHIFEYDSAIVNKLDIENSSMYYQKDFETVPSYLSEAFYVHCSEAVKNCAPEYGYFYNGTYFKDGKLINPDECSPYRMTCVGFCLGILQGWHTEDGTFLDYEDWNAANSMSDAEAAAELNKLKEIYHYLDEEELKSGMRRIRPAEYLSSAFIDKMPVQKALIDPIAKSLNEVAIEIALENNTIESN